MVSEILKQERLDGGPKDKNGLIDKVIVIEDYVVQDSKFQGQYAIVQAYINEDEKFTFIANSFMLKQLKRIQDFPITLRISRTEKGYVRFESSWICPKCSNKNPSFEDKCRGCDYSRQR